jgi:putative ATPase
VPVRTFVERALAEGEGGLGAAGVTFDNQALDHIVDIAGGDARFALNALEVCVAAAQAAGETTVTAEAAEAALQRRILRYDKAGDMHYDVISAFIKSMRGTDPDAAVFWLNQMLEAGEDAEFIARRMVILASEDIGNADPMALVVAVAAFDALRLVGLPEAALNLAQAATYLASAPKSNAATALSRARADLAAEGPQGVPLHLREAGYPGAKRMGHGRGYEYPHSHPEGWVDQDYLPRPLPGMPYYEPTDRGLEAEFSRRLGRIRAQHAKKESKGPSPRSK